MRHSRTKVRGRPYTHGGRRRTGVAVYRLVGGVLLSAVITASSGCARSAHQVLPSGTLSHSAEMSRVPVSFTFAIAKHATGAARHIHYVSSSTRSISLLLTDAKNHDDSADIFASLPSMFKAEQSADVPDTNGDPAAPGQCGPDPANAVNVRCTLVFLLPIGDDYVTFSSWDSGSATGNLLSQFGSGAPLWVQAGRANAFAVIMDAQTGAATCPNPSIAVRNTDGAAVGSQCVGNSTGTFYLSGTSTINFASSFSDAAGNIIDPTVPGAPKQLVGYTGGGTIFSSYNPYVFAFKPDGVPGTTQIVVFAEGISGPSDGIAERNFRFTVQKDAQTGAAGCPSPSIVVTPPSTATGAQCNGSAGGTFTVSGTSASVFAVSLADANGTAIGAGSVGAPTLTASGGGTVATVTASQNPYQLIITPTGSMGSASITATVTSTHPGDGVVDRTTSFTVAAST